MKLLELFQLVKDDSLQKDQLEEYHKIMSEMYAEMHLQMADIKKKKAIFMLKDPEKTGVDKNREWGGSEEGLREIDLKGYIRATSTHLKSLKNRLYSIY